MGGKRDPPEISAVIVKETLQEEEIITDPVLKAFRRYDEAMTNVTSLDNLSGFISALLDDELELGTHKFYSELTEDDVSYLTEKADKVGLAKDGDMSYEGVKEFLEADEVKTDAGKAATNLVSCLLVRRIDTFFKSSDVIDIYSPRSWRERLDEMNAEMLRKPSSKKSGSRSKGSESPKKTQKKENDEPQSARAADEEDEEDDDE